MRVLLYGAGGFLGGYIANLLRASGHGVVPGQARVDDYDGVMKEIDQDTEGFTHILSCTGRTHGGGMNTIDYLEQKGKLQENLRDNLYGPLVLGLISSARPEIHCTIMGTGCIFTSRYDAQTGLPLDEFKESSEPNFFGSSYSVVKGFTDRLFHLPPLSSSVLNVRIRMPIFNRPHPRCFITKIVGYEKVCSVQNSMTYLPELFPLLIRMMKMGLVGTMNLCNPGTISHNEVLELYRRYVDPSHETVNFSEAEQAEILAAGRSNNRLDTSRLVGIFPEVKHIREAVEDAMKGYADEAEAQVKLPRCPPILEK